MFADVSKTEVCGIKYTEAKIGYFLFQDIDPNGSGVMRADDIPTALSATSFLISMKLGNDRERINMQVCKRSHVGAFFKVRNNIIRSYTSCQQV